MDRADSGRGWDGIIRRKAHSGWEFVVEDSCPISGRGLALFGVLSGFPSTWSFPAVMESADQLVELEEVHLEFVLRKGGDEQPALLIVGTEDRQVPVGSEIRPQG